MGYSYTETATGELLLNCEGCGTTDDVQKRVTCPFSETTGDGLTLPMCPPAALCPKCYDVRMTEMSVEDQMLLHQDCAGYGLDVDDSIFTECDECGLHSNCKCRW